jgi:hypothetical protein
VLSGASTDIASDWAAKTADLTAGDWVMLSPEKGVLELTAPLTIAGEGGTAARVCCQDISPKKGLPANQPTNQPDQLAIDKSKWRGRLAFAALLP